jgi:hypothetical protein
MMTDQKIPRNKGISRVVVLTGTTNADQEQSRSTKKEDIMNREDIMRDCPGEFESKLEGFLDEVESDINEVESLLDIKGVGDLGDIESAYSKTKDLAAKLY